MTTVVISLSSFQAAGGETAQRRSVIARMAEALWTSAPFQQSFQRGGRTWQSGMARYLGVSREDLASFVEGMGGEQAVRDLLRNPAGPAPAGVDLKKLPLHMAASYGCPSIDGCPTSGCPTSGCATSGCGTWACAEHKPTAPKHEPA